jgi:hypothetical protein
VGLAAMNQEVHRTVSVYQKWYGQDARFAVFSTSMFETFSIQYTSRISWNIQHVVITPSCIILVKENGYGTKNMSSRMFFVTVVLVTLKRRLWRVEAPCLKRAWTVLYKSCRPGSSIAWNRGRVVNNIYGYIYIWVSKYTHNIWGTIHQHWKPCPTITYNQFSAILECDGLDT